MFKLLCIVLIAAFSWQLASCRYLGQPNYHGLQPYPTNIPYSNYGYSYSGPSHYQPSPYQLTPYRSPTYSPPGTYYDHRRGILRPFPGGGVPVLVDYHKRCSNQYVGLKAHPDDRQYYYVCKPDSVIFGKCQNLQVFNATCGQCVQYPRPEYMPNCESVGRYPIYSDCRIYFKCEEDLQPQIYSCPENMVFSPATQKCIAGKQCATTQISNSGSILPEYCEGKFPPCYENGVFRSPADCSLYYTCELQASGVFLQTRLRCTEGNFYDIQQNQCLPKQNVPCDCIQVAELVYPKPNPLPYQPSIYPSHFDIDSLEENFYPIESEEDNDSSSGDGTGDGDTAVTPDGTARIAAVTESPNESTDDTQILQDSIDIKNVNMADFITKTEQPTTESENIESSTVPEEDNNTEQEESTTANPFIEDETTTPEATIASPVTINSINAELLASSEPNVLTTEPPVEETTILQDFEGSGADSENIQSTINPEEDNEETKTTVFNVDDDPTTTMEPISDETTTVGLEDSSSVSPSIADEITTPAAPVNSTIASVQPQSLSRSLASEEVPLATDTQTLNKTLSTPIPTQEVPETTTTQTEIGETITNTQTPDMESTTATAETSKFSPADEQSDLDLKTTTQISFQTTQVPSVGSEITKTTHTTTQTPTLITTESVGEADTKIDDDELGVLDSEILIDDINHMPSATQTPTTITTEASPTDTTIDDNELGVLDSEILIDDIKQTSQNEDNLEAETTLATTVQGQETSQKISDETTLPTTVQEQETSQKISDETTLPTTVQEQKTSQKISDATTLPTTVQEQETSQKISDETTTAMPENNKAIDVDDDMITRTDQTIITPLTTINTTDTTATITEVTTAATKDSTTDVTLEDDELGNQTLSKNKESIDNNLLVDEDLLPVSGTASETITNQELLSEETTMVPATSKDDITQTTQGVTQIPTTITTEASVTVSPDPSTKDSFTDATLEDDELGILDSEITIDDSQKKHEESIVNNLLVAEEMLPVSTKQSKSDQTQETSLFNAEGTTFMPDNDITIGRIEDDDSNDVLGSEITQTDQTITTTITQTTPIPTNTTASVTEVPTTDTTESFTDVTLEDDVGLLDSEILIEDTKQASHKNETTLDDNLLLSDELLPVSGNSKLEIEDTETTQFMMVDETTSMPEGDVTSDSLDVIDQITTTPQTTPLETLTTDLPATTTIEAEDDENDELGVLDSELIIKNETKDTVPSTEFPVTESAVMTTVNEDDLITDEDEHGLLDSEINLQDVRTNQASSIIPSTPDTTEKTTQISSIIDATPKCHETIPTSNSVVIKVREHDTQSSLNSPNKCLHYFNLHTKPVINNNNTNSCNQTVTEPPCDKPNNGEIPRLEIIAERPIDVHFSICHSSSDIEPNHNCSKSSNHAVLLKWYPNKSNQTMSLETSNKIKTEGDIDD